MCNADLTVNTYLWTGPGEMDGDKSGPRRCTNWSRIQSWMDERRLSIITNDELLDIVVPMSGDSDETSVMNNE
ncbi:hypothetical protein GGR57DRAFT_460849 [Xylariaceae sp. FL1272]|nr:hypothetical protein GGR57DRAFT_460849 [Xylariaceae sp. FL1272]